MALTFHMLLADAGVSPEQVRLLRHQPCVAARSLVDVWRTDSGLFDAYQSAQATAKRTSFLRPYWASFIGTADGRTLFAGVYRVGSPSLIEVDKVDPLNGKLDRAGTYDRYATERLDELKPYAGRLFVEWGGGPSPPRILTRTMRGHGTSTRRSGSSRWRCSRRYGERTRRAC